MAENRRSSSGSMTSPGRTEHPRCSFCKKSFLEVRLVAGPKVHICEECTELCWNIFFGDTNPKPPKFQQVEPLEKRIEKYRKSQEKKEYPLRKIDVPSRGH